MDQQTSQPDPNQTPQTPAPPNGIPPAEKQWAMFAHLSGLLGYVGLPLANIIAPLIMWQMKKDEMPFGSSQAIEALNFQISIAIYLVVSGFLMFILIGFLLFPAVYLVGFIFTIIAALKANDGVAYRYPLTIRFIK
jgi:uncharacterized Tic20 family protein